MFDREPNDWPELSEQFGVPLTPSEDADPDESVFPENPRAFLSDCLTASGLMKKD